MCIIGSNLRRLVRVIVDLCPVSRNISFLSHPATVLRHVGTGHHPGTTETARREFLQDLAAGKGILSADLRTNDTVAEIRGGDVAPAPIEPYETGMLDTGDGNLVYWETCGNPDGLPALVVHGGPGSGCSPDRRGSFDPERHRIISRSPVTPAARQCARLCAGPGTGCSRRSPSDPPDSPKSPSRLPEPTGGWLNTVKKLRAAGFSALDRSCQLQALRYYRVVGQYCRR